MSESSPVPELRLLQETPTPELVDELERRCPAGGIVILVEVPGEGETFRRRHWGPRLQVIGASEALAFELKRRMSMEDDEPEVSD